jgi:hypothetical protein
MKIEREPFSSHKRPRGHPDKHLGLSPAGGNVPPAEVKFQIFLDQLRAFFEVRRGWECKIIKRTGVWINYTNQREGQKEKLKVLILKGTGVGT